MKTLVPLHSSSPCVSWEEECCAGAAAARDLQSVFAGDGTHAKCTVTQEAAQGDSFLQQHEGRGKNQVFLSLSRGSISHLV